MVIKRYCIENETTKRQLQNIVSPDVPRFMSNGEIVNYRFISSMKRIHRSINENPFRMVLNEKTVGKFFQKVYG